MIRVVVPVVTFVIGWIAGAVCAGRYAVGYWPWQEDDLQ